ncbi:hypothetical protein QW180_08550 [Vibrio sinaloensis]|nr:hypothetical protein [Vibrio sinaloensis]
MDDEINFDTSKEVIWLLQNYSEKNIVDDISRSYVKPSINLDLEDADSNIKDKKTQRRYQL